jgi:hypothetical protein
MTAESKNEYIEAKNIITIKRNKKVYLRINRKVYWK